MTARFLDIDIYLFDESKNKWIFQDGFHETGPIAFNKQMIPISHNNKKVKVKIILNKGLWRIDYLALTNIMERVVPKRILPSLVYKNEVLENKYLKQLLAENQHLISMPGDKFNIEFDLPSENQKYELFLNSKGYYLEWMRNHWFKDEDMAKLQELVERPKEYLRDEAQDYKEYEKYMEDDFWGSRINTEEYSYHED